MIRKVISGGQTGVGKLGLIIAHELGIPTGGTAPFDYRTEVGSDYSLGSTYGLREHEADSYALRTECNVVEGDATVLFGDMKSPGTKLTIAICRKFGRPHIENPTTKELVAFLTNHDVHILNVAGNRASKLTALQLKEYGDILRRTFKSLIS
jgi:hypothetical protein